MSRTNRNFGHFYAKNGLQYREAFCEHQPGLHPGNWWSGVRNYDFRENHALHGRDGGIKLSIGYSFADGPHCYSSWDEVWGMYRKREAKYRTGRLRRLRDKKIIGEALADDQSHNE